MPDKKDIIGYLRVEYEINGEKGQHMQYYFSEDEFLVQLANGNILNDRLPQEIMRETNLPRYLEVVKPYLDLLNVEQAKESKAALESRSHKDVASTSTTDNGTGETVPRRPPTKAGTKTNDTPQET